MHTLEITLWIIIYLAGIIPCLIIFYDHERLKYNSKEFSIESIEIFDEINNENYHVTSIAALFWPIILCCILIFTVFGIVIVMPLIFLLDKIKSYVIVGMK